MIHIINLKMCIKDKLKKIRNLTQNMSSKNNLLNKNKNKNAIKNKNNLKIVSSNSNDILTKPKKVHQRDLNQIV